MLGPPALFARVELLLRWHVFLAADAEVALDGAAAHGATVELAEAGGADAGMSAGQQSTGEREVLADDAELLAGAVPERAFIVAGAAGHEGVPRIAAVVRTRLGEGEGRSEARAHPHLVVVRRVSSGQVELLRNIKD